MGMAAAIGKTERAATARGNRRATTYVASLYACCRQYRCRRRRNGGLYGGYETQIINGECETQGVEVVLRFCVPGVVVY
ncbi:hypothetical protein QL285_023169 [Trifolium repens]|nr:hypothetical protein QL285_023169 [Trifolium repens]